VTAKEAQLSRSRWLVVVGLLAVGCLLGGCGGDDEGGGAAATTVATTAATSTSGAATSSTGAASTTAGFSGVLVEAKVTGSNVQTASQRVRVDLGQKVRIQVEADRAEEVHVHGYDLKGDVAPGKPAIIDFTANVPGVFDVELEEAGLKLFELQVQ
jgi:FtsP/CotA-like multicopper oxidase with cupredoxin domain